MTRPSGIDWGRLLLRLGFPTLLVGLHGWARLLRACISLDARRMGPIRR